MNSSDSADSNEPTPDPRLRDCMRSLPMPDTPRALELSVRQRIRRRRIQRGVIASAPVLALVAALAVWWPRGGRPERAAETPAPAPRAAQKPAREIPLDQLDILFAPPPVDRLTILDLQDKRFVEALHRLEDTK